MSSTVCALVTRIVDRYGAAVILKNNTPRYLVVKFADVDDSEVEEESKRLLERNAAIYRKLAK